jgi:hypothetical protein
MEPCCKNPFWYGSMTRGGGGELKADAVRSEGESRCDGVRTAELLFEVTGPVDLTMLQASTVIPQSPRSPRHLTPIRVAAIPRRCWTESAAEGRQY